jgi:DNA-binding response OmpR family regulator
MRADHERILVIEDDDDIRELVAAVLCEEGFEVATARDGRAGLASVNARMPDVIVLDMRMPVMDGWEFAARFHEEHGDAAPIVVLTAADDVRRRAEEVGAAAWIGKPFALDTLIATVARTADLHAPPRAAAAGGG